MLQNLFVLDFAVYTFTNSTNTHIGIIRYQIWQINYLNLMHLSSPTELSSLWVYEPQNNLIFLRSKQEKAIEIKQIDYCNMMIHIRTLTLKSKVLEILPSPNNKKLLVMTFKSHKAVQVILYSIQKLLKQDRCQAQLIMNIQKQFVKLMWCPDSQQFLIVNQNQIEVYDLQGNQKAILDSPIRTNKYFVKFNKSGNYLAVCSRKLNSFTNSWKKDTLDIYRIKSWSLMKTVELIELQIANGLSWSNDTDVLVWDGFGHYKMIKISLKSKSQPILFHAEKEIFGINQVIIAPDYIALESSGVIRIIDNRSLKCRAKIEVPHIIKIKQLQNKICFKQTQSQYEGSEIITFQRVLDKPFKVWEMKAFEVKLKLQNQQKLKSNRKEIKLIKASFDGEFLAFIHERSPNTIIIWMYSTNSIYSIIQTNEQIDSFDWAHHYNVLCFCLKNKVIVFWSQNSIIPLDLKLVKKKRSEDYNVKIQWNQNIYRGGNSYLNWINDNQIVMVEKMNDMEQMILTTVRDSTFQLLEKEQ